MRTVSINHEVEDGQTYGLNSVNLVNSTLTIHAVSGTGGSTPIGPTASMALSNSNLGRGSSLNFLSATGETIHVALGGNVTSGGTITTAPGNAGANPWNGFTTVSFDVSGRFTNAGSIQQGATPEAGSEIDINATTPRAAFVNTGSITAHVMKINADMLGSGGIIHFISPMQGKGGSIYSRVEVDRSVSNGQFFDMANSGVLTIKDLRNFHGTIQDFSPNSAILLPGASSGRVSTLSDATGTILTVPGSAGSIHLLGDYRNAAFSAFAVHGDSGVSTEIVRVS